MLLLRMFDLIVIIIISPIWGQMLNSDTWSGNYSYQEGDWGNFLPRPIQTRRGRSSTQCTFCEELRRVYTENSSVVIEDTLRKLREIKPQRVPPIESLSLDSDLVIHARRVRAGDQEYTTNRYCLSLANAEQLDIESLGCNSEISKLKEVKSTWVDRLDTTVSTQPTDMCLCQTQVVSRWCYTHFFGEKEKEERTNRTDPYISDCYTVCEMLADPTKGVASYSRVPDWSCWWMSSTTVEGPLTTAQRISVTYNILTQNAIGSYIAGGSCNMDPVSGCRSTVKGVVLPIPGWENNLLPPKFIRIQVEYKTSDDQPNLVMFYNAGFGGGVINGSCSRRIGSLAVYPGLNGNAYATDLFTNRPECLSWPGSFNNPALSFGSTFETQTELFNKYRFCLLTKQAVSTALYTNTSVNSELLNSLSYRDYESLAMYTLNGRLIGIPCRSITYDDLVWYSGDTWVVSYKGKRLGCLDARLQAIFKEECWSYPNQTVFSLLSTHRVEYSPEGLPFAVPAQSVGVQVLQAMEVLSSESAQYLKTLYSGADYTDPTLVGGGSVPPKPDSQEGSSSNHKSAITIWWESLSFSGKFFSILSILVTVAIIIIICVCTKCCACCCKQKSHRETQSA